MCLQLSGPAPQRQIGAAPLGAPPGTRRGAGVRNPRPAVAGTGAPGPGRAATRPAPRAPSPGGPEPRPAPRWTEPVRPGRVGPLLALLLARLLRAVQSLAQLVDGLAVGLPVAVLHGLLAVRVGLGGVVQRLGQGVAVAASAATAVLAVL